MDRPQWTFTGDQQAIKNFRQAEGKTFLVKAPSAETGFGTEYLSLPKADIPALVTEYVQKLETGLTSEWCKCEWILHPDDSDVGEDQCRECLHAKSAHEDKEIISEDGKHFHHKPCEKCGCPDFKARRLRPGTPDDTCPVHSKEGRILGFFEYVFQDQS